MTNLDRARIKSLEWHLSDWKQSLTYEEILDTIRKGDSDDVLVWQPLETLDGADLADSIERLTEQLMDMTEEK